MSIVLLAVLVPVVLLFGVLAGLVLFHLIEPPADRRRLDALARRLTAEMQIDAATRSTLQAMRDAVSHHRHV